MEPFVILPKETRPEIRLGEGDVFLIAGRSIPENPEEIYLPVINWLKTFLEREPTASFEMEFRLEYINSGSMKYLMEILRILKRAREENHANILLKWYYEEEDEAIQEMGEHFRDYLQLPLELIAVYDE